MALRTSSISIFIVIPSAGDDIKVRAPSMGPIMVASTNHISEFWDVASTPT